jgi:hypothetical protein
LGNRLLRGKRDDSERTDDSGRNAAGDNDSAFDASVVAAGTRLDADASGTREVSEEQRLRFEEALLAEDLEKARAVAIAYALRRLGARKGRDKAQALALARQLADSAQTIAWERASWDPDKGPPLPVYYCSIIRSELSHEKEAAARREATEQASLAEPSTAPDELLDPEQLMVAREELHEDLRMAASDLEWLRAFFEKKRDEVNLRWLELRTEGVDDEPAAMAERSEFAAEDFYNAQKRRIRAVRRLLALKSGARDDDEEKE